MKTEILKVDPLSPDDEKLRKAAQAITSGKLVIIPTETVYGIAANSLDEQAIERLAKIKNRPEDKPFSLLIAKKEKIEDYATGIPISAYKLIEKFWPGPLTLVLKSKKGKTIGFRMPDHEVSLRILDLAGVPIACPSANLAGKPAPTDFEEALRDLEGKVELAINAGKAKVGVESSVVDLTQDKPVVLRQAAIKKEDIEAVAGKKTVLFVCTGNSCRSVMAQGLLEKKLKEKSRSGVEVISAGLMLISGTGPTEMTKQVLSGEGVDVSSFRSQKVTKEMLKKSDLILVMEHLHEDRILQIAPEVKNRVFLLKEFAKIPGEGFDILDPIGRPLEFYEETLSVIKNAVERVSNII